MAMVVGGVGRASGAVPQAGNPFVKAGFGGTGTVLQGGFGVPVAATS
jgi:hypothetical protein